jgi:ABC-type multidrug transport system ATPase subunit
MHAAIRTQELRKVYETKAAVDGLDLDVPKGSFFGFLGPNGAGKTTAIRMLMGVAPPTSGSIELLGMPTPANSLLVKAKIGLVPAESLLFDHLTGLEAELAKEINRPSDVIDDDSYVVHPFERHVSNLQGVV